MTTATQQRRRQIVCSNCGDGLGEYAATAPYYKLGPCCEGLPEPWDCDDNTGMYTAPAGTSGADPDDDDIVEEEPCQCENCRFHRGELDPDEIEALDETEREQYRRDFG